MNISAVPCLHYVTSVRHVAQIRARGIQSRRLSQQRKSDFTGLSFDRLDAGCAEREVAPGRVMPDYVHLFLNARNHLLRRWVKARGIDDVCVLRVHRDVLKGGQTPASSVFVCSQHPGRSDSEMLPLSEGLSQIADAEMYGRQARIGRWMRHTPMALIPDQVIPKHLLGAFVATDVARDAVYDAARDADNPISPVSSADVISGTGFPVRITAGLFGFWNRSQIIEDDALGAVAGTPGQRLSQTVLERAAADREVEEMLHARVEERRLGKQWGWMSEKTHPAHVRAARRIVARELAAAI